MSGTDLLPAQFHDLEHWAALWALPTEAARSRRRVTSEYHDLEAFYHALLPRMDAVLEYLKAFPAGGDLPAAARRLAGLERVVLICGRYEGVDERVLEHLVTDEISIGDTIGVAVPTQVWDVLGRLLEAVLTNLDVRTRFKEHLAVMAGVFLGAFTPLPASATVPRKISS